MAKKKTSGKSAKSKTEIASKSRGKGSPSPPKTQNKQPPLSTGAKKAAGPKVSQSGPDTVGTTPPRTKPKGAPKPKPRPVPVSAKEKVDQDRVVESGRYDLIRKILETQKSRVLAEAQGIVGDELNAEDALPDLGDRASAETDQNFTLRLRERGQNLVKKIDEAIERIDMGTFGVCEVCGGQIAMKRLTARPVTTLCIECKTDQERTERAKQ